MIKKEKGAHPGRHGLVYLPAKDFQAAHLMKAASANLPVGTSTRIGAPGLCSMGHRLPERDTML